MMQNREVVALPGRVGAVDVKQRAQSFLTWARQNRAILCFCGGYCCCSNKFFWTISVRFLTRVTGTKAKVRANFSKMFAWTRCFFGILGFWVGCGASITSKRQFSLRFKQTKLIGEKSLSNGNARFWCTQFLTLQQVQLTLLSLSAIFLFFDIWLAISSEDMLEAGRLLRATRSQGLLWFEDLPWIWCGAW